MTEKMTAEQARHFDRESLGHVTILALASQQKGCACQAYVDWFTYRRWQAQGMQVQKGEHGVRLTTYIPERETDDDGERVQVGTRPKATTVFCRCQVKPKGETDR